MCRHIWDCRIVARPRARLQSDRARARHAPVLLWLRLDGDRMSDLALCVSCGTYEPAPVLCIACQERARRDLDTIGRLRRELDPTPGRGRVGRSASGKPGSRPPANLTVLSITDVRSHPKIDWEAGTVDPDNVANVDHDILTEVRLVIEERHLAHPLRDTFDAIRILNLSFEWCCRSPRADEFVAVLASCAQGLRQAVRDGREPAVGRCTAPHASRTACNGPLRLVWPEPLHSDPDAIYAPTGASCGVCGSSVDVPMLLELLAVFGPAEFPVPRQWAADMLGLRVKTITQWVRRGHVRAYSDEQINLMDVIARVGVKA